MSDNISISKEDSLILQSWSSASMIGHLSNTGFLKSNIYLNLPLSALQRWTIDHSGIGNPAMMQMMLYALLVIPKEILSADVKEYHRIEHTFNIYASYLAEEGTVSTYKNEQILENINYYKHIRNSVSHSRCEYYGSDPEFFVHFLDNNQFSGEECHIRIRCDNVGKLLDELSKIMELYLFQKYRKE